MLRQKLSDSYAHTRKLYLILLLLLLLGLATLGILQAIELATDGIIRLPEALLGAVDTRDGVVGYYPSRTKLDERARARERIVILDTIFALESSRGRHESDTCRKQGKVNGYGWKQSSWHWNCYNSHAEVASYVHDWIADKQARGMTTSSLMCYYNTGYILDTCDYYEKALSIKLN